MNEESYVRGAFIAYPPGTYRTGPKQKQVIPFRFNPEGLSRQLQVEQGKTGSGTEGAPGPTPSGTTEQAADASSGAVKQTFTVQLRVDLAERAAGADRLDPALGVEPEVAALENLLYPAEDEQQAPSDGTEANKQRESRPTVLFIWGRHRVIPVRITGMTINETMHNAELRPVRAEVDVQLEVLGQLDAKDKAVAAALDFTTSRRRELADEFFKATSAQGTNILPL